MLAKRAFDLVGAAAGLVVAMPLFGGIALAVRLTSPGPILFRQRRVTQGGKVFTIYKFRTMVDQSNGHSREQPGGLSRPFFKLRDDPRLTRVGGLLRRYSLDELPQLFNVLRGDLSLVGPRPLWVNQVHPNRELLEPRHTVKAGLTGWWQVNGRNDLSLEQTLKLDLFYIENWSLWFDVYILVKTVEAVLRRNGAY